MNAIKKLKTHYNFTPDDEERLKSLYSTFEPWAESVIDYLEARLANMGDSYIIEKMKSHPRLSQYHQHWLLSLFKGPYDNAYHRRLIKIGKIHAAEDISPHFVSAAMSVIRSRLLEILSEEIDEGEILIVMRGSLNKILDINLDVITSAYVEEEIQQYSTAYRLKSSLVTFAERFSGIMNLILVFALIVITLGVVGLFFFDMMRLVNGDVSSGIITALGSLLVLWVLIELMNTEISHLKGGKFNISVFVGVALVAFIRDLLIATLEHEDLMTAGYLVVAILVLGLVYWLVVRSEARRPE